MAVHTTGILVSQHAWRAAAAANDPDSMWGDDCVELFVDPTGRRQSYYQFSVNTKGVHFCRFFPKPRQADNLWEAPPYRVAVRTDKEGWTAEFALPVSMFTRSGRSEKEWAFNASRYQSASKELAYWSAVYAGFSARPERFGILSGMPETVLAPARAGAAIEAAARADARPPVQAETIAPGTDAARPAATDPRAAEERAQQARQLLADSGVAGGLCVNVGRADGAVLSAVVQTGAFIGYGLSASPAEARALTEELAGRGLHGAAFCESGTLAKLPLSDNIVNLLIVDDFASAQQQKLSCAEVLRVLCPYGVAYFGQSAGQRMSAQVLKDAVAAWGATNGVSCQAGTTWIKVVKPYPGDMDEWTHVRHGADNNAVSHDTALRVPNSLRWIAGPSCTGAVPSPWENLAGGASRMVSARGRNIYLIPTDGDGKPPAMTLAARDAFNGLLLWARPLPQRAAASLENLRPPWLVAGGDSVYTEIQDEIVKVDARTGRTLASFGTAEKHRQALLCDSVLVLAALDEVRGFDATTGKRLWSLPVKSRMAAAEAGTLFCLDADKELSAVTLTNGVTRWKKPVQEWVSRPEDFRFVRNGAIVFETQTRTGEIVHAFSVADGTYLWAHAGRKQAFDTFARYGDDLFAVRDRIWKLTTVKGGVPDEQGGATAELEQLDPQTGAVQARAATSATLIWRCYPLPATDLYLIGNRPPSFMAWADGVTSAFRGTRGGCGSGLIVANGLLYTSYLGGCHCVQDAVNGIAAFATDPGAAPEASAFPLERYALLAPARDGPVATAADWPMFRHDAARSSATTDAVPEQVQVLWETTVAVPAGTGKPLPVLQADWRMKQFASDPLTGPTLAGGRLFVSLTDGAEVVALDAATGKFLWRRAVGGRLDTPPACYRTLCLVGAHDGWVYALRAEDGALAWRLRAAPAERRIVAFGELASPWPVVGGVLIEGDTAYCLAGRDTEVDGGLLVHAFRPETGELLWTEKVGRWIEGQAVFSGPANVLSCDGRALFIGGEPVGAIDQRTHRQFKAGATFGVTAFASAHLRKHCRTLDCPSACSDQTLCVRSGSERELLAYDQHDADEKDADGNGPLVLKVALPAEEAAETLVNAAGKLIVGVSRANSGAGAVRLFSLRTGAPAGEVPLADAPVREGLAVSGGRIYVATRGGRLVCLGEP